MSSPPEIRLLGMNFADLDTARAASWLSARPPDAPFGYVVTPNADHLVRLRRQPALAPLYDQALLRLLDSRVVARVAASIGLASPPVAPGSDLTGVILCRHLRPGERLTIIGLDPVYLRALTERTGIAAPAHHNPPSGFEHDPRSLREAVEFALAHPARFILLAVGSPRQEILAAAIQASGRATGTGLCIGASLDFLSGAARRAPFWMQRAGLEWLHRLASNPRRMARRYLRQCPTIFPLLLRERWEGQERARPMA